MEWKDVAPLSAVIGALITTSLAAWYAYRAYRSKTIEENRRLSCEALFSLLGIWRVLRLSGTKRETDIFVEVMKERLPEVSFPNDDSAQRLLQSVLEPMLSKLRQVRAKNLKEQFATAVVKLSAVQPVLAFEINPTADLLDLTDHLKEYADRARSEISEAEYLAHKDQFEALMEENAKNLLHRAQEDLKADILKVAQTCGKNVYEQTRQKIEQIEAKRDEEIRKLIDDFLKSDSAARLRSSAP